MHIKAFQQTYEVGQLWILLLMNGMRYNHAEKRICCRHSLQKVKSVKKWLSDQMRFNDIEGNFSTPPTKCLLTNEMMRCVTLMHYPIGNISQTLFDMWSTSYNKIPYVYAILPKFYGHFLTHIFFRNYFCRLYSEIGLYKDVY